MNHTAQPDGALCVERAPVDRLPNVVALSNRGDASGDVRTESGADAARTRRGPDHGPRPAARDRAGLPHRVRRPRARRRRLQPPLPRRPRDLDHRAPPARPRTARRGAARPTTPPGASGSVRGRTSSSGSSCSARGHGPADAAGDRLGKPAARARGVARRSPARRPRPGTTVGRRCRSRLGGTARQRAGGTACELARHLNGAPTVDGRCRLRRRGRRLPSSPAVRRHRGPVDVRGLRRPPRSPGPPSSAPTPSR